MICKIQDVREFRPLSLPAPSGWKRLGVLAGVMAYAHVTTSMRVTVSLDTFEGGERFLHVAVSRRGRLPSWDDLKRVKTPFTSSPVPTITSTCTNTRCTCGHRGRGIMPESPSMEREEWSHLPIIDGKVGEGVKFERIRRITGYLVGTVERFNNAKRAEVRDRVKHMSMTPAAVPAE